MGGEEGRRIEEGRAELFICEVIFLFMEGQERGGRPLLAANEEGNECENRKEEGTGHRINTRKNRLTRQKNRVHHILV